MNKPESYYAVIFTSVKAEDEGYQVMAKKMMELASRQPGFLGVESARDTLGITVSYWQTEQDILHWKQDYEHLKAQKLGKMKWYDQYSVRVCKVEREYHFKSNDSNH